MVMTWKHFPSGIHQLVYCLRSDIYDSRHFLSEMWRLLSIDDIPWEHTLNRVHHNRVHQNRVHTDQVCPGSCLSTHTQVHHYGEDYITNRRSSVVMVTCGFQNTQTALPLSKNGVILGSLLTLKVFGVNQLKYVPQRLSSFALDREQTGFALLCSTSSNDCKGPALSNYGLRPQRIKPKTLKLSRTRLENLSIFSLLRTFAISNH